MTGDVAIGVESPQMSKAQQQEIRCHEAGFTVCATESEPLHSLPVSTLRWDDVNAVIAYKRDIFAFDLICLGFGTANGSIEVNEQMHGWSHLIEELPLRLPGTPPFSDWWERVAQPPFAPCVTKLFERP
jgi:hypothetical protein